MNGWLTHFYASLDWASVVLGAGIAIIGMAVSVAVTIVVMVRLPADYFHADYRASKQDDSSVLSRWCWRLTKNLIGACLVLIGMVLSLPGIPGQGLLTILLGVLIMDFPGKRKVERRLVNQPLVLSAINRVRAHFKKPPLVLD